MLSEDKDDWTIENAAALSAVLNLAGWVHSGMVHITLRDLLDIEHHYPNLMHDIDTCIWQVMLIQNQRDAQNG